MGDDIAKVGPGGPENRREIVLYLAGFLDGEGCILARRRGTSAEIVFEASQVVEEPLLLLQSTFGGAITSWSTKTRRTCWKWRLYSRLDLRPVLEELLPFLTVKRSQAYLAIKVLGLLPPASNVKPLGKALQSAVHILVDRISELKRI